ncbi:alpha/beta fold hydrolase [Oleomonas cavernae]|uniref:alpha/beta fold hydrolase n=1 Tax=Oleomonas cavernae TaxID=2320859 RepID=UPI0018F75111|nr:alpha/beta fold hydrolase [Oleomonas cavernae]
MDDVAAGESEIEVREIDVGGQKLCVAVKEGASGQPPLLLFNGIGANWELARPFLNALTGRTAIIFDVPGIGKSPLPLLPYRPCSIASLGARIVQRLGFDRVDAAGVSWGGGWPRNSPSTMPGCAAGWCWRQPRPAS